MANSLSAMHCVWNVADGMQVLEHPQMLTDVMNANPSARKIMEANPRLHQLMTSPNAMRSLLSGAFETRR